LGYEFRYGRERRHPEKPKRHPLNFVFDPLYPMIMVAVFTAFGIWYFDVPRQRLFDMDTSHLLGKWTRWR
jgi:hypothetical protein